MTYEPEFNPFESSPEAEIDMTPFIEILRGISTTLVSTDLSSDLGPTMFTSQVTELIYCEDTGQRSLERCNDVVTGLTFVIHQLLEHFDDPNEIAEVVAEHLNNTADEMPPSFTPINLDLLEFEVSIDGSSGVIMSLFDFVDSMDLPLDEFASLVQDLSLLESGVDVESIFRIIDEGET